jgi:hypothetical protein
VGIDGDDGEDEMVGLADVMVVDELGREGVGGLVGLPRLEKTFKMILSSLDIALING